MWHFIVLVLKVLPIAIWDYFAWVVRFSGKKKDKYPLEKRYKKARKLIRQVLKAMKCDLIVEGKELLPEGKACYFGNHLSALDPLAFFDIFEEPISFVGKIEVKKYPVVGRVFTATDSLFLDRSNLKQQLKVMLSVQDSLANGHSNWFIFAEGTRNKDQMAKLLTFQHGAFRSAMKAGVPIVPFAHLGEYRILSTKHSLKKYPTHVKFLKPIYPEEYANMTTEEVAQLVQSRVQQAITFDLRKKDHAAMCELKGKKYRFNRLY